MLTSHHKSVKQQGAIIVNLNLMFDMLHDFVKILGWECLKIMPPLSIGYQEYIGHKKP